MADFHQMIVDEMCQMICRHAVGFKKYLVVESGGINYDMSSYQVLKMNFFIFRHFKPDNIRLSPVEPCVPFYSIQRKRIIKLTSDLKIVNESPPFFSYSSLMASSSSACQKHNKPGLVDQPVSILPVDLLPVALAVGPVFTTLSDTLINGNSAPSKRLHYIILGASTNLVWSVSSILRIKVPWFFLAKR
jgi:hypothetical protein